MTARHTPVTELARESKPHIGAVPGAREERELGLPHRAIQEEMGSVGSEATVP